MGERWPPVYDTDSLITAIRELASRNRVDGFYATTKPDVPCQGDIFKLSSSQPIISEDGTTAVIGDFDHWLITGNSCDFTRATTIGKSYLRCVTIEASLEKHTWYLLHSCLVRYLARDDGRFD